MDKVTVYVRSEFGMGIKKIEATRLNVTIRSYAQYAAGIVVELLPKGKRKMRGFVQAYGPSLVVLEGWNHPDPEGMWKAPETNPETNVTTQQGRYSSCDPRWQSDFDSMFDAYVARGPKVLYDFRKHNPSTRECQCVSCSRKNEEIKTLLSTFKPVLEEVFA